LENIIKAIVAFAQEKSDKDVLALALGVASINVERFRSNNYKSIVKETLKEADKIGIQDEEVKKLYQEVRDNLENQNIENPFCL
jgi:cation transport regulator ChaC